jgi:hypothetical protein
MKMKFDYFRKSIDNVRQRFQKDKSQLTSDEPSSSPAATTAQTEDGIVPEIPPVTAIAAVSLSPNKAAGGQLWLRSAHAPIWNVALETLKTKNPTMYEELDMMQNTVISSRSSKSVKLFELNEEIPESKAIVQRMKRYLPSLASVKAFTMAGANLDPHKLAPIICASIFFTIEVHIPSFVRSVTEFGSLL